MIPYEPWTRAVRTPGQSAALSEGFCEPCRTRLRDPVTAIDGDVVSTATQCPSCRMMYLL